VGLPDGCVEREMRLTAPPVEGEDVLSLQWYLSRRGMYRGPMDGKYGEATANAVASLQRSIGLSPTGVYDAATWRELEGSFPCSAGRTPPPTGEVSILIDVDQCRLTVLSDGVPYKSYVVAIGKPQTPSPVGEFRVTWKEAGWHGATGTRWLGLSVPWGMYGIHGTNMPWTIGSMASAGCFRMWNHDVEEIFPWVKEGTRVIVVGDLSHIELRRPLGRGDRAQEVVVLQQSLRKAGFYEGYTDGDFGPLTEEGVMDLQLYYGLKANGVADGDVYYLLERGYPLSNGRP